MSTPNTQPQFRVIRSIKVAAQDPTRLGQMDRIVTYQVNGKNSFTIRIPADYTTQQVTDAIKADYKKEAAYLNLSF